MASPETLSNDAEEFAPETTEESQKIFDLVDKSVAGRVQAEEMVLGKERAKALRAQHETSGGMPFQGEQPPRWQQKRMAVVAEARAQMDEITASNEAERAKVAPPGPTTEDLAKLLRDIGPASKPSADSTEQQT